jgi:hypothetical protein
MKPDQSKGNATKVLTGIDSRKNASKRPGFSTVVGKSRDTWEFECADGKKRLDSSVKRVLTPGTKRVEPPRVQRVFKSSAVSICLHSITSVDPAPARLWHVRCLDSRVKSDTAWQSRLSSIPHWRVWVSEQRSACGSRLKLVLPKYTDAQRPHV